MNIFIEKPHQTITLEDLYKLLVKYDKIYEEYAESYYEGRSIAIFIDEQLTGESQYRYEDDEKELFKSYDNWINQEI